MIIEQALYERLTSVVGTVPVYAVVPAQNTATAHVRYQLISREREYHLDGAANLVGSLFQIDCFGGDGSGSYLAAKALADTVRSALSGTRGTWGEREIYGVFIEAERDEYDSTLRIHRVSVDYRIFHNED